MSKPSLRIVVVEDDEAIRRFVRMALELEGHEVFEAALLARGLIEMGTRRPDLLILDLGLPDGDGVELIRDVRGWSTVPIIVLSARSRESDKIEALDAGADDFLVKPFGAGELLARVRVQMRRTATLASDSSAVLRFGANVLDLDKRVLEHGEHRVHLTPIEFRLLSVLVQQPDRVLTYRMLLQAVWGPGHAQDVHYVRVHMANLRKKVELDPSQPRHLLTEPGVGYRFVVADEV